MIPPWLYAMKGFFGESVYNGQPVPVIFADPDRAHEEYQRTLKRQKDSSGATPTAQAITDRPAPVPFMSVWMSMPRPLREWYSPRRMIVSKDKPSLTALVMRAPMPYVADVQVDMWCGTNHRIAGVVAPQTDLRFIGGIIALPVDWSDARWYREPFNVLEHAKVLGRTRIRLYDEGWEDTSDLEQGTGPKEVRVTWSGRVEGYMAFPPEEARLARTLEYNLYDNTDPDNPELLISDVTGAED